MTALTMRQDSTVLPHANHCKWRYVTHQSRPVSLIGMRTGDDGEEEVCSQPSEKETYRDNGLIGDTTAPILMLCMRPHPITPPTAALRPITMRLPYRSNI